jgi:hypothetical protein
LRRIKADQGEGVVFTEGVQSSAHATERTQRERRRLGFPHGETPRERAHEHF